MEESPGPEPSNDQHGFTIDIDNFGPIKHASITPANLTVFIGPNNSGKSYAAMLVHVLINAFTTIIPNVKVESSGLYRSLTPSPSLSIVSDILGMDRNGIDVEPQAGIQIEGTNKILRWIQDELINGPEDAPIPLQPLQETILAGFKQWLNRAITPYLNNELPRIFSGPISSLARNSCEGFTISLSSSSFVIQFSSSENSIKVEQITLIQQKFYMIKRRVEPFFEFTLESEEGAPLMIIGIPKEPDGSLEKTLGTYLSKANPNAQKIEIALFSNFPVVFIQALLDSMLKAIYDSIIVNHSVYLPAARSGLLQGQKVIASAFYQLSSVAGMRPMNIPALPGVVADFLMQLQGISQGKSTLPMPLPRAKLDSLAEMLEANIIEGIIELEDPSINPASEIIYTMSNGQKLSLNQASSMVNELASIILYFKHFIQVEDFLIIEEPESHLHPGAQRVLAYFLARAVRAGLRVLITTHSEFLVLQLSHLIEFSTKTEATRQEIGFFHNSRDYLNPEEVAVHLFTKELAEEGECGTTLVEHLVVDDNGIDEKSLSAVSASLYDESIDLERE
jgi:predicted ATPase